MQDDKVGQPAVAQTQMTVYRWEVNIPAKAEPAEVAKTLGCTVASAEQAQELGFPWTELQEFCDVAFKIKGLQPREAVKILVSGYDKLEQQLGLNRLQSTVALVDALQIAGDTSYSINRVIEFIIEADGNTEMAAEYAVEGADTRARFDEHMRTPKIERSTAGTQAFLDGRVDDPNHAGGPKGGRRRLRVRDTFEIIVEGLTDESPFGPDDLEDLDTDERE